MAKEIELQQKMLKVNGTIEMFKNRIKALEVKIAQIDDEKGVKMLEEQLRITNEQYDLYFQEQKLMRGIETNRGKKLNMMASVKDDLIVGVAE